MKKRIEEELASLAFDESGSDAKARLEQLSQTNPGAVKAYDSYCRMREELRSLSVDVPADQLSTERLREAILARGLSERKQTANRPTWIWVPVGAALLAFGISAMKGNWPNSAPVTTTVVERNATEPGFNLPGFDPEGFRSPEFSLPSSVETPAVTNQSPTPQYAMNESRRRSNRRDSEISSRGISTEEELPAGIPELSFDRASTMEGAALSSNTISFGSESHESLKTAATVATPEPITAAGPTIVVIQPETDKMTGTLKATEVENTANVVVGG
ncbi:MAG TPA: hypothetical protein VJ835_05225 [Fimbriimonadaceae bacterium]|nr:hypothetical protein [Fimbriimonadaceae bacterium]